MTTYAQALLAVEPASLIAYWPLTETSGSVAANAAPSGSALNGTYTNCTLNAVAGPGATMGNAPTFNGTTSFVNLYSAALAAAFNSAAGTLSIWLKRALVSDWTASGICMAFTGNVVGNVPVIGTNGSNAIRCQYTAGGINKVASASGLVSTSWINFVLTWDKPVDQVKGYQDAAQIGSTLTALGVWSASGLNSNQCCIGATAITPSNVWKGQLGHAALWSKALTLAEIAILADADSVPDPDAVALVTETLAGLNTTESALYSTTTETLAPLNVTTQETAVVR